MAAARFRRQLEFVSLPELAPEGSENKDLYGVYVLRLTPKERLRFAEKLAREAKRGSTNSQTARIIARLICNENGKRLAKDTDWKLLSRLPAAPMNRIWLCAAKLNGFSTFLSPLRDGLEIALARKRFVEAVEKDD